MARTEKEIRKDLELVESWCNASAEDRQLLTAKAKKLLEINRHQLIQELEAAKQRVPSSVLVAAVKRVIKSKRNRQC